MNRFDFSDFIAFAIFLTLAFTCAFCLQMLKEKDQEKEKEKEKEERKKFEVGDQVVAVEKGQVAVKRENGTTVIIPL